jgi:hypothetical protein
MKKILSLAAGALLGIGLIGCASDKAAEAPAKPEVPAPKPAAQAAPEVIQPAEGAPHSYALVIPIKEGKTEAWKAHRKAVETERVEANNQGLKIGMVEKEVFFVMPTPNGDMGIGYFEGPGATVIMSNFMQSTSENAMTSKKELGEVFPLPGPDAPPMPTNEQKFDVKTSVTDANAYYSIAVPIVDQAAFDAFMAGLTGEKKDAFVKNLESRGIAREQLWVQPGPEGKNVMVVVWQIKDPKQVMNYGDEDFGKWIKAQIKAANGVDLNGPPPPPTEQIGYFEVK